MDTTINKTPLQKATAMMLQLGIFCRENGLTSLIIVGGLKDKMVDAHSDFQGEHTDLLLEAMQISIETRKLFELNKGLVLAIQGKNRELVQDLLNQARKLNLEICHPSAFKRFGPLEVMAEAFLLD